MRHASHILLSSLAMAFIALGQAYAQGPAPDPAQAVAGNPAASGLLPDDPAPFLGIGLAEALSVLGAPARVEVVRGEAAWQDDVVFLYPAGSALFWSVDRLWQLRFSAAYPGSVYGIFIGDTADKVVSTLGTAYFQNEGNLVFRLAWRGYPVRIRTVIAAGRVTEIYVYRADY